MSNEKPILGQSGLRWLWVSALVIVIDQLTKLWIVTSMPGEARIYVLSVFNIIHTVNPGMAFSFLADWGGIQRWLLSAVAIGVSLMLLGWLRALQLASHRLLSFGLTLIVGGAIGNVIDRLRLGHVIDFLDFHWGRAHFPAFNVADSAICVGAVFVLYDSAREWWQQRQAKQKAGLQASGGGQ